LTSDSGDSTKIIVVCGSTGVGKTGTAIKLARSFSGEIISADSIQVYKLMDIGAAKPTLQERAAIPHHLINVVAPDEPFDAARFARKARVMISTIRQQGRTPFVVGGTGLYIKALLYGLADVLPSNHDLRRRLQAEAAQNGALKLHQRLETCETVRLWQRDTRRYAKRQLTWFKSDPDIRWFNPDEWESILPIIDAFLR